MNSIWLREETLWLCSLAVALVVGLGMGYFIGLFRGTSGRLRPVREKGLDPSSTEWLRKTIVWPLSDLSQEPFLHFLNTEDLKREQGTFVSALEMFLQGRGARLSGDGTRARRIHELLLADETFPDRLRPWVRLQCVLDCLTGNQVREAETHFNQLPWRWRHSKTALGIHVMLDDLSGKVERAAGRVNALLKQYPHAEILRKKRRDLALKCTRKWIQQERYREAEKVLVEILQEFPRDVEALLCQTDLALRQGDDDRAELSLLSAAEENRDHPLLRGKIALLASRRATLHPALGSLLGER